MLFKKPDKLTPAIVMVADRTLTANYKIIFEGMFGTMQSTKVPEFMMRNVVAPPMPYSKDGRALAVPLGMRRIEAILLSEGVVGRDDIVCTTPEALGDLLGEWVKLVIVSSSDPLGRGMSNTTTDNFWDGELYTKYWTAAMMRQIRQAKQRYGFEVLVGGAGAWQWANDTQETEQQGIDYIYEGYFEPAGVSFVCDILRGGQNVRHIREKDCGVDKIKPIVAASLCGIIELSRGCGKGCNFCSMANQRMEHLSKDIILSDIETNVRDGMQSVVSGSEDFFRYGARGFKPDPDKLISLLEDMKCIRGLGFMQIDHGNISTILQYSDEQLKEIRALLSWEKKSDYLWVNMGVESASGKLVHANSPGKTAPFEPESWEDMVKETADKMTRCGYFPVFSLILGLPGETPADVQKTINLVKYLEKRSCVIFPIFYEPIEAGKKFSDKRFTLSRMTRAHLELYSRCYEINFRQVPAMFWDNQRAGGVSWARRALIRILGKFEVRAWRKAFEQVGNNLKG